MALIDDVKDVLNDLAPHGWKELFDVHGLDITASDLESKLQMDLSINRQIPGFKEFAIEGKKGITAGLPAHSLVYHALASPNVQWADSKRSVTLRKFPTLEQIETVENYVYAKKMESLDVIEAIHGKQNLAIVVFANQYRTARDTPHKKHADFVYSRTGIARVGNAPSSYNPKKRSFDPLSNKKNQIRVLPAKYNAYIAIKAKGSSSILGKRINPKLDIEFSNTPRDENMTFWSPIHKLFDGPECLENLNLQLDFQSSHKNEKISKIHKYFADGFNLNPGSNPTQLDSYPFEFSDRIADYDKSSNLLFPIVHSALVEKAKNGSKFFTLNKQFNMPFDGNRFSLVKNRNSIANFSSSMEFRPAQKTNPISRSDTGAQRSVPEYAHVRTKIVNGTEKNINLLKDNIKHIAQDKYDALHYVDFCGDGFISVSLLQNSAKFNGYTTINAYSIVSPPDFFPFCDQVEIFDLGISVWSRPPQTLADIRLLPNLKSHPQLFFNGIEKFDTCTALICGIQNNNSTQTPIEKRSEDRVSYLSDAAAGVFAPGWDTSFDMIQAGNENIPHLAAYGLGSPFPEDAKLCAAISSFWPAVAPDISRSFWPAGQFGRTVIPLTDEEIGSDGSVGWDGEKGPIVSTVSGKTIVTYKKFDYVDYTANALNNKFDYHKLANINSIEYLERIEKLVLAKQHVSRRALLLGYVKKQSGPNTNHKYRFIVRFKEMSSTKDQVKVEVLEDKNITIDSNNKVTIF